MNCEGLQLSRLQNLFTWLVKELQMNTNTLYRDVMTGLFFGAGILGFVSGQFILSTLLFGMASVISNIQPAKPVRV